MTGRCRARIAAAGAVFSWVAGAASAAAPDWAFPGRQPAASEPAADQKRLVSIPRVSVRFKAEDTDDAFRAVDWRPSTHTPMPPVVAHGRPPHVMACGYCHLPDGEGRPENAALAGLPRDYIIRQVRHFATGERANAAPGWVPGALMSETAHGVSPAELTAAAHYFSRSRFTARVRVVEAATIPNPHAVNFLFVPEAGRPAVPLGQRIAIAPASMERFERRDSWVGFTAYVPVGALKRGAALAVGADGVQPCSGCHGEGLKGGVIGPPLAGRSPIYLFRQLYGFQSGARSGADAAPMRSVTESLSQSDMIALAAYAGSLKP